MDAGYVDVAHVDVGMGAVPALPPTVAPAPSTSRESCYSVRVMDAGMDVGYVVFALDGAACCGKLY